MAERPRRTIYGRRRGKPLRPARRQLVETLLPELRFSPQDEDPASVAPEGLFSVPVTEVWLEIGFGAGEHLAAQAAAHPGIGFLGAETFVNGVARLLSHIETRGLRNIRIVDDDAAALLRCLRDDSIGRAFLLFPDPWPKARHHKRRFVNPVNIAEMARLMRDGGLWRMATDDRGYCRWMLVHMTGTPAFAWTASRPGDWRQRPADWPATRYEQKALAAGRRPAYLSFRRRPRRDA